MGVIFRCFHICGWQAHRRRRCLNRFTLSSLKARAYFGDTPAEQIVGRQLTYSDSIVVTVSGVVKDLEHPTDLTFKEFISRATVEKTGLRDWWSWEQWGSINSASQCFLKLEKGVSSQAVDEQILEVRKKHVDPKGGKENVRHFLRPFVGMHFDPDYGIFDYSRAGASKTTIYSLLAVAAFLLILGCINFVNLSTAQATQRAKEIGIRKTMGSSPQQLVWQFLTETFVLTLTAMSLAVALVPLFLDILRDYVPPDVSFSTLWSHHVGIFLPALTILVSLLAGGYPAFVLTRFQPVSVLRNQILTQRATSHRGTLRRVLTVAQFVIAQFLLIATIVVSKQILFSINKELGFRKDAIVFFHVPSDYRSPRQDTRRFTLLQNLRQIPEIMQISLAGSPPAYRGKSSTTMRINNGKEIVETQVQVRYADTSYFALYGLKLVAGRGLTQSDTLREFVVNEMYTKALGLTPEEALSHFVEWRQKIPIVGVVADFHTRSTHEPIKPHAFSSESRRSFTFHLGLDPANPSTWKEALGKTEAAFKALYPNDDFKPEFFDATIGDFYKTEQRIARLLNWAAGFAIFISCLGLLGLVIYTTNVRVKEIGVRKVLGATVLQIVSLLSKDLLALVLVAFVIAAPVGWWAMQRWLEDFAYRTSLSWWVFVLSGAGMLLVALMTLGIRTFRSASENPVKSLRAE